MVHDPTAGTAGCTKDTGGTTDGTGSYTCGCTGHTTDPPALFGGTGCTTGCGCNGRGWWATISYIELFN